MATGCVEEETASAAADACAGRAVDEDGALRLFAAEILESAAFSVCGWGELAAGVPALLAGALLVPASAARGLRGSLRVALGPAAVTESGASEGFCAPADDAETDACSDEFGEETGVDGLEELAPSLAVDGKEGGVAMSGAGWRGGATLPGLDGMA
jgi:hypothetical protein